MAHDEERTAFRYLVLDLCLLGHAQHALSVQGAVPSWYASQEPLPRWVLVSALDKAAAACVADARELDPGRDVTRGALESTARAARRLMVALRGHEERAPGFADALAELTPGEDRRATWFARFTRGGA